MKYTMKNISLLTCSLMASIVVLSACAQTTVTVRPVRNENEIVVAKPTAPAQKHYEPISRDEAYTVQAGDTLYGISFRAGLSYREVAAWNNIVEPYTVKIGQRLLFQPPSMPAVVAPTITENSKANDVKPVEINQTPIKSPVLNSTPAVEAPVPAVGTVVKPPVSTALVVTSPIEKPVDIKLPENTGAIAWRWPSDGTVIARYVQGDTSQQGINIGGKSGQAVKASSDGTVVYSGAGLVGYGELIIIKHNNEWLSAYAHNRRRLVAEGTKVKAGDVIAEMGRTGTMRDMLHFEIRRNGKPVDPLLYLPKQ
ncbi:MAG: peptidoglycan DD-metalloendopeptidase family protein [Arenimonas sp.]